MKNIILILCAVTLVFSSCRSNTIKETINKAGDVTGQAVGEFASGVTTGVEKAFDVNVQQSEDLVEKGVAFGKTTVSKDSLGTDNVLVAYVIFNKDFTGQLTAKAFDNEEREMGRSRVNIVAKSGDARYVEFHFDKRTNIDQKNKLTVE